MPREEPESKYIATIGSISGAVATLHRNWRASRLAQWLHLAYCPQSTCAPGMAHYPVLWSPTFSLPSRLDRSTARNQASFFLMAPEWSIHLANHQSLRSAGVRETSKYDSHFSEACDTRSCVYHINNLSNFTLVVHICAPSFEIFFLSSI